MYCQLSEGLIVAGLLKLDGSHCRGKGFAVYLYDFTVCPAVTADIKQLFTTVGLHFADNQMVYQVAVLGSRDFAPFHQAGKIGLIAL